MWSACRTGIDPASQPTLSLIENAVTIVDLPCLRDVLCDEFLNAFTTPPPRITLDLDPFDDQRIAGSS